ncbi:MAG: phosphatase PAP2 family protein [Betaproteobacteria bacterium]|nr:phosphatase PAP2 family protein [Betaproteobacteria bacterium]
MWQRDVAVAVCTAVLITLLFANGQVDFALARPFFSPDALEHWPLGREMPWSILYQAAPWITASLVLGGLAFLVLAFIRHDRSLQRKAVFVVLSVVLGPGLLVNAIFKDHWDRPRPRDVVEFGGTLHYSPAPLRGDGGKSFPCGHCSVGFLYALGWWLWRRQERCAIASLAVGLAVGMALGIGRMAAGGHFPSDIVWSAFISFTIAHWLYWYGLKIPFHESDTQVPTARWSLRYGLPVVAGAAGVGVLIALYVTAHGRLLNETIPLTSLGAPVHSFEFSAPTSDVEIIVVDSTTGDIRVSGELHGFGLPGSSLDAKHDFIDSALRYFIEQNGWFTDLDCRVSFEIPARTLRAIAVHVGKGNILLRDATREHLVRRGKLRLDLQSNSGRIRRSEDD